jgi:hypothetical protein
VIWPDEGMRDVFILRDATDDERTHWTMGETHSINVTIPVDLKDALNSAAEMQDRTTGTVVKRALEHYLRCVDSAENPCQHRYDERGEQGGRGGVVGVVGHVAPVEQTGTPGTTEKK